MENGQKALQMAFAAFLFVIAATTAIFLYTTLINNAKRIMVISDNNNMSAEYVDYTTNDFTRYISKDEIVMTILDIENNKSYIEKIVVINNNTTSTFDSSNTKKLSSWLTSASKSYTSSYDEKNKILKYIASN